MATSFAQKKSFWLNPKTSTNINKPQPPTTFGACMEERDATRRPRSISAAGPIPIDQVDETKWTPKSAFFDLPIGMENDPVDHPKHYTAHPSGVECIQITEHMGFCLGNAVKYIWRADIKGNAIEDLKKAKWYIEREIDKRIGRAGK
jgi:hypothetical protein